MDNCQSCRFFTTGDRMGLCKLFPNAVNKSNEDWCGQHEAIKNAVIESIINPPEIAVEIRKRGRPAKK